MATLKKALLITLLAASSYAQEPTVGVLKVGYGAISVGGAGGDTYVVRNLNDSGPGSLRDGLLNRKGPRVVTCQPGLKGTIKLATEITMKLPYLTWDFSACPDLSYQQRTAYVPAVRIVATHDVIVHQVRSAGLWRPGMPTTQNAGTLSVDGDGAPLAVAWDPEPGACGPTPAHRRNSCRIILDRVTLSGAADDGPDFWCGVSDLTISRSFVLDSFHPRGTGCKGLYPETHPHARRRITEYANVYAYNGDRNPKLGEGVYDYDFVNNIVFAWQDYGSAIGAGPSGYGMQVINDGGQERHNVIGNVWLLDLVRAPICLQNTQDVRCRERWDCVWGPTWKNNNETAIRADILHYSNNVFAPLHNQQECVSTEKGKEPVSRPYTLRARSTSSAAEMEKVLDMAGVPVRTVRETSVIEKVRAALRARLGP